MPPDLILPGSDLEASRLLTRIWQGSYPQGGDFLKRRNFQVLALCAKELQTPEKYSGISIYLCPMNDAELTEDEAGRARQAALRLADCWRRGDRLLITCAAGLNRSGLVSALTIRQILDCTGEEAVEQVRSNRHRSLFNPSFVGYLTALGKPSAEKKTRRKAPARR